MKTLKFFISTAIAMATILPAYSIPAKRDVRTVKQPDGTTLRIKVIGDEHLHFTTTETGDLLILDTDGCYKLASIGTDGALKSTGIRPAAANAASVALNIKDVNLRELQVKRSSKRRAPQSGLGLFSSTYPTSGSPKALVILVEYQDVKFKGSYPKSAKDYFTEMINGKNFTLYNGTGSALEYFSEQSGGKFTPEFDVLGPVTLPQKMAYYGKNDKYYDEDENAHLMVTHAIDILDKDVDFSQYDTDKDGYLDNVYIFYAGQGEADYGSEDTVWPHSWNLLEAGINKKVDGVTIANYACSNEWDESAPTGVGTFIHEFSHVMGIPDLYNTVSADADYTPGEYSVMDYGPYNNDGRTPPNYGAYEKNAMGWFEPIMLDGPVSVSLEQISSGQFGLMPTSKNSEFYLFENRQLTGWDKYIPNHGLLVWHIDFVQSVFDDNSVNNTKSHQYVDIVEANNKPGYQYEEGYTFPGTTGKTSLTSTTSPALKEWSGKGIDLPVTDIAETDGIITFDVAGGGSPLETPLPFVNEFSESKMFFVAEWTPVDEATEYFLTVYGGEGAAEGEISIDFSGKNVADGWTASSTGYYDTSSNYGDTPPSFKFSNTDQTLTSPSVEGDVTSIEFWAKGQSSKNTFLIIEGLVGDQWVEIDRYEPVSNKSETATIDNIPSGVRQVRFRMQKSQGNIAIDDIVINYGGGIGVLPDYDNISVGTATSHKVDKLLDGVLTYQFTVTVSDGKKTRTSNPVLITLKGESRPAGASSIEIEDAKPIYYNLQGVRIDNPLPGQVVIERRGNKTSKIVR